MGEMHDIMANHCGDVILKKIRGGDKKFGQVFSTSIARSSDWNWPRPDYVYFDSKNNCSYALEFKPANQTKREYLTGLGQAISYLQRHMYSGLIVPEQADDGFEIADFICCTLKTKEFDDVAISLYSYDPKTMDVSLIRPIKKKRVSKKLSNAKIKQETFWCWWRDCSQYEVVDLLTLSFKYNELDGDIYTQYVYPEFLNKLSTGQTYTWEKNPRNKSSLKSQNQEKQNYKIPLNQLQLWNPKSGKLTKLGIKMLEIGKLYGADSKPFMDALAYLLLVDGEHLELIKKIEEYQVNNLVGKKVDQFLLDVERDLQSQGCIGPRKPSARKTNAKETYIRDEPKVWHKFGIVEEIHKNQYFFPGEGYKFNWHKIADILISGQRVLFD